MIASKVMTDSNKIVPDPDIPKDASVEVFPAGFPGDIVDQIKKGPCEIACMTAGAAAMAAWASLTVGSAACGALAVEGITLCKDNC